MMNHLMKLDAVPSVMVFATLIMMLTSCESKRKDTVWEMYDVRHPVPAGSSVPVSRVQQMERYYDNDVYYVPPTFGSCGSNNIGFGGCE